MVIGRGDWQVGTVPITRGHLAYHRTGGRGPVLVLLHGLTDNGLCWSRLTSALAPEFDILMLDARGHGGSSRVPPGGALEPSQDLAEAIDLLGFTAPIMMGHSVGARAVAAFAAADPDRVSFVILEDPPLLPPAGAAEMRERRDRFHRHVTELQSMSGEELEAFGRAQSPGWHADEFAAWVEGKQQVDAEALPDFSTPWQQDFAAITVPTLLIYGEVERGGMITRALASEAVALNPNIQSVRVAHAGHNIRRENFEDYLTVVRGFLQAHGRN